MVACDLNVYISSRLIEKASVRDAFIRLTFFFLRSSSCRADVSRPAKDSEGGGFRSGLIECKGVTGLSWSALLSRSLGSILGFALLTRDSIHLPVGMGAVAGDSLACPVAGLVSRAGEAGTSMLSPLSACLPFIESVPGLTMDVLMSSL